MGVVGYARHVVHGFIEFAVLREVEKWEEEE